MGNAGWSKMKPITKQLAIAAFILASVTVLSFGIRKIRLSNHRANTIESPIVADTEDQPQPEQPLNTNAEPDYYPGDSYTVDDEQDSQYADASDWDEQVPSDDYSEAQTDSGKPGKAFSKAKLFKGDYAKAKGSKGLQKISLGDNEELYLTGEGKYWYVSKQPDGKTTKMQVQIDDATGELIAVDGGYYSKSEGSQEPQRIPMGEYENIYITGEGEAWYTSEPPDGSDVKVQLQPE